MDSKIRVVGMEIDAGWCVGMKTENRMYVFIMKIAILILRIQLKVCVEWE